MRRESFLFKHGTKKPKIVYVVWQAFCRLRMRAKGVLHPFFKRIIFNQVSLTAENVLLEPEYESKLANKEVYIAVNHGRLNHWINVTLSLYALAIKKGLKPRLLELGKDAFPVDIASHFRAHVNSPSKAFPRKKITCLYSDENAYFYQSKFRELLKCISSNEMLRARSLLSKDLSPVYSVLRELPLDLLALCGINSKSEFDRALTVSMHLRRGDLSILWKKDYIGTAIEELFENDVLLIVDKLPNSIPGSNPLVKLAGDWAFVSFEQYEKLRELSCCNAIIRRSWSKPLTYYIDKVNSLKERHASIRGGDLARLIVVVFSDGFDRVARFLSRKTDRHSFKSIKNLIETTELGLLRELDDIHLFVGEPHPLAGLSSVLSFAMNAKLVLADDSGFPMSLLNLLVEE